MPPAIMMLSDALFASVDLYVIVPDDCRFILVHSAQGINLFTIYLLLLWNCYDLRSYDVKAVLKFWYRLHAF